jgi:hypothetical protein
LAKVSSEIVEAVIGRDEPGSVPPDDVESRFQQILDDVERLQQQQQQQQQSAVSQDQPNVSLACSVGMDQYVSAGDAERADLGREFLGGAMPVETADFGAPSSLVAGPSLTEEGEGVPPQDGDKDQDGEEMNDSKEMILKKQREKKSEKDVIRPLVEKLVSTRKKWWDGMDKCWIQWEDGSEDDFV